MYHSFSQFYLLSFLLFSSDINSSRSRKNSRNMISKKYIFFSALLGEALSLIIDPNIIGFCQKTNSQCFFESQAHSIGKPMFIFFTPILMISLFMLFVNKNTFQSWVKFSSYWLPSAALVIFITPEYDKSLLSLNREFASFFLGGLYLIIFTFLFVYNLFKLRKGRQLFVIK